MDKKNTLLLTVIAIATLLVAVVGATFAYFTAQNSKPEKTDFKVTTETTNSSTIRVGNAINIKANDLNFADQNSSEAAYVGSQKGVTNASVSFAASSSASESQKFCYTVSLNIADKGSEGLDKYTDGRKSNNIEYSTANKESKPELVFVIKKAAKQDGYTESYQGGSYTNYDGTNKITDLDGKYNAEVLTETKVCLNDATSNEENQYVNGACDEHATIAGWDITGKTGEIKIPKLTTDDDASANQNNDYVHMLNVSKGTTLTDYWQAEIILVNHNFDQNQNTGKEVTGTLTFTPVSCTTGEKLES